MRATWLADVARSAGLHVVETDGWRGRGKDFVAFDGIGNHHTASPATSTIGTNLSVVINGNSVAPGPIANYLLWRDGTVYVIADGKANHAGAGGPWGGWLGKDLANTHTIGIEAVNNGVGEVWAPAMLDAYLRLDVAILRQIRQGPDRVFLHREYAPTRKIDPAGPTGGLVATIQGSQSWDGLAWRALIAERMSSPQPPSEDDDMAKAVKCEDGRPALFAVNGITLSWVDNPDDMAVAQRRKTLSSTVEFWPPEDFLAYRLVGACPPGWSTVPGVSFREVI